MKIVNDIEARTSYLGCFHFVHFINYVLLIILALVPVSLSNDLSASILTENCYIASAAVITSPLIDLLVGHYSPILPTAGLCKFTNANCRQ